MKNKAHKILYFSSKLTNNNVLKRVLILLLVIHSSRMFEPYSPCVTCVMLVISFQ